MTAPGGTIVLESAHGNLEIEAKAILDVSAAGADSGSIRLVAPNGVATLAGTLIGTSAGTSPNESALRQGRFSLDADRLDSAGVASLGRSLLDSGFTESVDLRVRTGGIQIPAGGSFKAHQLKLSSDSGAIGIDGFLDASGDRTGTIELYAAQIRIGSGALLNARNTSNAGDAVGGQITISASGVGPAVASTTGIVPSPLASLSLAEGARIEVNPAGPGLGGRVVLRAPQTIEGNDVDIQARGAQISGSRETLIEAVRIYRVPGDATISERPDSDTNFDATENGRLFSDAARLMQSRSSILSRIGIAGARLQPGIEIQAEGNLTVSVNESSEIPSRRGWDLSRWRFADQPVALTLRAASQLELLGSISDGFINPYNPKLPDDPSGPMPVWQLGTGASASYRMTAGADLRAADLSAVNKNAGDLVLGFARKIGVSEDGTPQRSDPPVALLRTGTGQIQLAAGRDIVLDTITARAALGDSQAGDIRIGSTVYTAGEAIVPTSAGGFGPQPVNPDYGTGVISPMFGSGGGAITLNAGRDIVRKPTPQLINNWLYRRGNVNQQGDVTEPAAWWIRPDFFGQGLATFGGGDVSVTALSGNVLNLAASVGSTAWVGAGGVLTENGGGALTVSAGKDIMGGVFYAQKGSLKLVAGGAVKSGEANVYDQDLTVPALRATRPVIALGNARASITAAGDLEIEAAFNPTITLQSNTNVNLTGRRTAFSTYGPESSVRLVSAGGNVVLNHDSRLLDQMAPGVGPSSELTPQPGIEYPFLFRVAPPQFVAVAIGGSVDVRRGFTLSPSLDNQLQLLAEQSVGLANGLREGSGTVMLDVDSSRLPGILSPRALTDVDFTLLRGALQGLQGHDLRNLSGEGTPVRIVARTGDIVGDIQGAASITSTKPVEIQAGRDIVNLGFRIQQSGNDDLSLITAGRDFLDTTITTLDGNAVDHVITGPGRIAMVAGRDIDFGNSRGLRSRGNLDNPYLPEGGASLQISAGVPIDSLSSAGAASAGPLGSAKANRQFFAQLVSTAREPGLTTFDSLIKGAFPTLSGTGDIKLTGSQVRTEQGGAIDLFAPAGSINVSLIRVPDFIALLPPSNLGLFTIRGGDIRALVKQDFAVNSGRVFSLRGGDITLVSQYGNIDAGRGSKTASSAPPPLLTTDQAGNTKIDIAGSISGSGIATLRTSPDQPASNVYPVAPRGIFDAGDAGVRSTGTVEVVAQTVLNAGNISAAGGVSGAPSLAPPALAVAAPPGASAATDASNKAVAAASSENRRLLNLDVEVVGYGTPGENESGENETEEQKRKRRKAP
jgi:hypothetical protein